MKKIETDRLILRPLAVDDADSVFKWCSDPIVNRFMPYPLYKNVKDVVKWIESLIPDDNDFAFTLKETGEVIGSGSVTFDPDRNGYEIGYNLNKNFWGNGYATEAAKAMIKWAYEKLGARDFVSNHANLNVASGNVIRKCGFVFDHYGQYSKFDGSVTFEASFYILHLE